MFFGGHPTQRALRTRSARRPSRPGRPGLAARTGSERPLRCAPAGLRPASQAAIGQVWRDNGGELGQPAPPVTLTVSHLLRP
jgi:hypothetical protein